MTRRAPTGRRRARIPWPLAALLAVIVGMAPALASGPAAAQARDEVAPAPLVEPTRTDDPRETFRSFLRLSGEMEAALSAYLAEPTLARMVALALLSDRMNALLDLSAQPAASRREAGIATMTRLMDVFGRLPPIDPDDIPDAAALEETDATVVRIPGTPLYISRIDRTDRYGEHLFAATTVDVAPRLFETVRHLPLRTTLPIESFGALGPQLTGPLIPARVVGGLPEALRRPWLGTPIWKTIAIVLASLGLGLACAALHGLVARLRARSRAAQLLERAVLPTSILLATTVALPVFLFQINPSGALADILTAVRTVVAHLAGAWLFWIGCRVAFEWIIRSPRIPDASLDANLLRLISNVLGFIGAVVIAAYGGQAIGVPIMSIVAGLGIGGLAMALALRPTLENLVGGVILYMDRPVRVGDYCRFGDQTGTIEAIGVRSTRLRALDRTVITVPNAQFADMQISNFAHCDSLLVQEVMGVRHETTPDQLRWLLAEIRSMLHAHPRVDTETVRVRLAGYGESSLDIDLRIYVLTREWNDWFAIREDVLLRIHEIVVRSGTGFAFPSRTLYMARDAGLDADRAERAESEVAGWRRDGRLPFPHFAARDIDAIAGTLDWPPRGSVSRSGGLVGGGEVDGAERSPEPLESPEGSDDDLRDGMRR